MKGSTSWQRTYNEGISSFPGSTTSKVMEKYRLDEDAKSKLREIIEKRAEDKDEILVRVKSLGS